MSSPVRDIQAVHDVPGYCLGCKTIKYVRVVHGRHNGVLVGFCADCDRKEGDDGNTRA